MTIGNGHAHGPEAEIVYINYSNMMEAREGYGDARRAGQSITRS